MKHTGTSMGGSIIYTRRVRPIPCDCRKCYHKRRNTKQRYNYCSYYEIEISTNKSKCARYYGPKVVKSNTSNTNELKKCNNCIHYGSDTKVCNKFNFKITTYGLGRRCKEYSKCTIRT